MLDYHYVPKKTPTEEEFIDNTSDYENVGARNSQMDRNKSLYEKNAEKKISGDSPSMFTGNTFFDIGLAIGRRKSKKMQG